MMYLSFAFAALSLVGVGVYLYFLWDLRREIRELNSPKIRFRTAAHEAGHAIAVLGADRVKPTLHSVTTVPDEDSGGKVQFNLTGFPVFVQWEQVIIALGGAAGEFVAKGDVHAHGCGRDLKDALESATAISGSHTPQIVKEIELDLKHFYKKDISKNTLDVLNFCFAEAVRRVRGKETEFFQLVDTLLARRELTGEQVREVLSQRSK